MAREDGEQQAMTSERLAEINSLTADVIAGRIHARFDEETAWLAILDARREVERLLAEVERQRADNERLRTALVAADMRAVAAGESPYSHKRTIELIDEREHLLDVLANERVRAEEREAALVEKCAVLSDVLSLAQLPDDHIGEVIGTRRSRRILCACTVCVHARATLGTVGDERSGGDGG